MNARSWSSLALPLLLCLTVGLAPFSPEPHVVEKIRWIAGGAEAMRLVDWFDLLFHGAPWVWLSWRLATFLRGPRAPGKGAGGD